LNPFPPLTSLIDRRPPHIRKMRFTRPLAVALTAAGLATCADAPSSIKDPGPRPGGQFAARVAVAGQVSSEATQTMAALAAVNMAVNNVRVVLVRPPSDTLKDTVVNVTPGQTSLTLDLTVNINGMEETLTAEIELRDGSTVLFSGSQSIVARATISGLPPAENPPIPLGYVGPGSNVARIDVSPATASLAPGVTQQYTAIGVDAGGAPVPDLVVAWSTTDGTIATIDGATGLLTAGQLRGSTIVRATSPSLVSGEATVSVVLPAAAIESISGNAQSASVGSTLPQPLVVRVRAADNVPVEGATVSFAVVSGGGSVSAAEVVTDAEGLAQVVATLGSSPGENSFSASVAGIEPAVPFTATATPGAVAAMAIVAGDGQAATPGTAVAIAPSVRVTDSFGNPVPAAAVTFTVTSGGGSVSGAETESDAIGVATVGSWTLGASGEQRLSAASGAHAVEFTANSVTPRLVTEPEDLTTVSVTAGEIPSALIFRVLDHAGAPLAGLPLSLELPDGEGTGTTTIETDAGGRVTGDMIVAALGGAPEEAGSYPITASGSLNGVALAGSPRTVTLVVQPGPAATMTIHEGDGQSAAPGEEVPVAPAVLVVDAFGNRVPGAAVTFAVISGGGSLTGENSVTGPDGVARVGSWTLGSSGEQRLRATHGDLSVDFTTVGASVLGFTTNPPVSVGTNEQFTVVVEALDAFGNRATSYNGEITVALSTDASGATLAGQLTQIASSGVATFPGLSIDRPGTGYILVASGSDVGSANSTAFNVTVDFGGIYGAAGGSGTSAILHRIDRETGQATPVGPIGFDRVGAMDFHPATGVLYAAAQRLADGVRVLITIDPATGAGVEVGPMNGLTSGVSDMSFRSDGILYLLAYQPSDESWGLFLVDIATGSVDAIGNAGWNGGGNSISFDAADVLLHTDHNYASSISVINGTTTYLADMSIGVDCFARAAGADLDRTSGVLFATIMCSEGGGSYIATIDHRVATFPVTVLGQTEPRMDAIAVRNAPGSEASTPATISLSPQPITMVAGSPPLSAPPTVLRSADNSPMPGVGLRFSYESGEISWMTLMHTDAAGEVNTAVVLGGMAELLNTAGTHIIVVSTDAVPLSNSPFEITVDVMPGPATTIAKVAGDEQEAGGGQQLPINPSIHLADAYGNDVPGLTVTFSVTSGGGSVTGGSVVSDANGVATVGWTVGSSGPQVLTATAGNLSAQFTATITSGNILGTGYTEGGVAALYDIDRATGATTLVDTLHGTAGQYRQVGAIDFHPGSGVLYGLAMRPTGGVAVLVTIEPATAFVTEVGPTGVSAMVQDAAFRSDGRLYISAGSRFNRKLYTVDISTGAATEVSADLLPDGGGNGMAFDASDVLLHSDNVQTNAVSTADAYHTKLADLVQLFECDGASRSAATDLDRISGHMLAVVKCPGGTFLGRIDHLTGEVMLVGPTHDEMDGMAVRNAPGSEQVPAPATLSVVGSMQAEAGSSGTTEDYVLLTSAIGTPMPGVKLRFEYNAPPEEAAFAAYVHTDASGRVTLQRLMAELQDWTTTERTWPLDVVADLDAIIIGNAPYRVDLVITAPEVQSTPLTAGTLTTQLNATFGTPTIDGRISVGEWSSSECGSVTLDLPQGGTGTGVLCARNDNEQLYMLFQLDGNSFDYTTRMFHVELDEDNNGFSAGDDYLSANAYTATFFDMVRRDPCDLDCLAHDAAFEGQTHGSFSYGFHGNHHVFEVSKPLATDDRLDFHRTPGTSIFILPGFELANPDTTTHSVFNAGAGGITLHLAGTNPVPAPEAVHDGSRQWTWLPPLESVGGDPVPMDLHNLSVGNRALYPSWFHMPTNGDPSHCPLRIYTYIDQAGESLGGHCDDAVRLDSVSFSVGRWMELSVPVTVRIVDQYTNIEYASDEIHIYGPQFTHTPRMFKMNWAAVTGAYTYEIQVQNGSACDLEGDWRNCGAWANDTTHMLFATNTEWTNSFTVAAPGRWRVLARDPGAILLSTSDWKYFRFRN
jgi:hypothetical protein